MLLWHLAGSLFLFRWIFRDPKVDVRFLLFGAILPDIIDLPFGTLILADRYSTGALWFHSLVVPTAIGVVVLAATRRGPRRKKWMALVIGLFFHLLLDGMWTNTEVFLWPLAGDLPSGSGSFWSQAWMRAGNDPIRWLKEIVAAVYLVSLYRRLALGTGAVRREVLTSGHLPVSDR